MEFLQNNFTKILRCGYQIGCKNERANCTVSCTLEQLMAWWRRDYQSEVGAPWPWPITCSEACHNRLRTLASQGEKEAWQIKKYIYICIYIYIDGYCRHTKRRSAYIAYIACCIFQDSSSFFKYSLQYGRVSWHSNGHGVLQGHLGAVLKFRKLPPPWSLSVCHVSTFDRGHGPWTQPI